MKPFDFLHLRSPLQAFDKAFHNETELSSLFDEGLYLASRELWMQLKKYHLLSQKEKAKLDVTFLKYWVRSCSRCTPYGTFAGTAVIKITDEESSLIRNKDDAFRRTARVDMNYLSLIIRKIETLPTVKDKLRFFTNNSVYEMPHSFRYLEYQITNNYRSYQVSSIHCSDYIQAVLNTAVTGATIETLTSVLQGLVDVDYEEAYDFVVNMWESQLLVSELEPCVTGDDPLTTLLGQLKTLGDIGIDLKEFEDVINLISSPAVGIPLYQEIEKKLTHLFDLKPPKDAIQTDLYLSFAEAHLQSDLVDGILQQVEALKVLGRIGDQSDLERFKRRFNEKFDNQEIPLTIALDPEIGIGYSRLSDESVGVGEIVDDIGETGITANSLEMNAIKRFCFDKYHEYLLNNMDTIEINDKELKALDRAILNHYPKGGYVMGSLLKTSPTLDRNNFSFDLAGIGGPSGANLLSRFAYDDPELTESIRNVTSEEAISEGDAIIVEVVHLPQARTGNVLLRPLLRTYELPYLGRSGAELETQISVNDLMVRIVNGKVILRSKSLNKTVIPRLTTAHNYLSRGGLPLYKFLGDLQNQSTVASAFWDWGILDNQRYLPRVHYKNIIVQKAHWKFKFQDFVESDVSSVSMDKMLAVLKKYNVPELICIKESDNKLLINMADDKSLQLLLKHIEKHRNVVLEEYLFNKENCIVRNQNNDPFTHELVIPLKPVETPVVNVIPPLTIDAKKQRKFLPNSEWLYFKIYCGPQIAESILNEHIVNFVEEGLAKTLFEHFFFIRYNDSGGSHIRVRFFNSNIEKQQVIQKRFLTVLSNMIENGMIGTIQIDTYERELERYNSKLIETAEKLFHNDSLAVLKILRLLPSNDADKYRILLAMRGIDLFLDDFQFSIDEKLEFLKEISESMFKRFGGHSPLRENLNLKYKKWKNTIFNFMDSQNDASNDIAEAIGFFSDRSGQNASIIAEMGSKINHEEYKTVIWSLLPSYTHMFVNRLFVNKHLKYELLVYSFLERYYSSKAAILKKQDLKKTLVIEDKI